MHRVDIGDFGRNLRSSLAILRMEQNIIIYIGIYKALVLLGTAFGGVVTGTWIAASRLGSVEAKIDNYDLRLTNLEGRMDGAFSGRSPVALSKRGRDFLDQSGLAKYVDDRANSLLSRYLRTGGSQNPYDIQVAAFQSMDQHDFGRFEEQLKTSAFGYGLSMETARRIAAIYLRDRWLDNTTLKNWS